MAWSSGSMVVLGESRYSTWWLASRRTNTYKLLGPLKPTLKIGTVSLGLYSMVQSCHRVPPDLRAGNGLSSWWGSDRTTFQKSTGWEMSLQLCLENAAHHMCCLRHGEQQGSSLPVFLAVFSNPWVHWQWCFFPISAFPPPCFPSIKIYCISHKGKTSLLPHISEFRQWSQW